MVCVGGNRRVFPSCVKPFPSVGLALGAVEDVGDEGCGLGLHAGQDVRRGPGGSLRGWRDRAPSCISEVFHDGYGYGAVLRREGAPGGARLGPALDTVWCPAQKEFPC